MSCGHGAFRRVQWKTKLPSWSKENALPARSDLVRSQHGSSRKRPVTPTQPQPPAAGRPPTTRPRRRGPIQPALGQPQSTEPPSSHRPPGTSRRCAAQPPAPAGHSPAPGPPGTPPGGAGGGEAPSWGSLIGPAGGSGAPRGRGRFSLRAEKGD